MFAIYFVVVVRLVNTCLFWWEMMLDLNGDSFRKEIKKKKWKKIEWKRLHHVGCVGCKHFGVCVWVCVYGIDRLSHCRLWDCVGKNAHLFASCRANDRCSNARDQRCIFHLLAGSLIFHFNLLYSNPMRDWLPNSQSVNQRGVNCLPLLPLSRSPDWIHPYENLLLSSLITAAISGILSAFFSLSDLDRDFLGFGFDLLPLLLDFVAGASIFGSSTGGNVMPKRLSRIFSSHSSMPCRWRLRFRCW